MAGFAGGDMNLSLDKLPINFFDVALLVCVVTGIYAGRKHGMSGELLRLLQWLVIIIGAAFGYQWLGDLLVRSNLFNPLGAYLTAYLGIVIFTWLVFLGIKKTFGDHLVASDIFGQCEFYLGMASGSVRYVCILLAGLALLNARLYTTQEVTAMVKFQNDVYGSNFFPTLQSVQASVFERSLTGPYIRKYLSFLLIKPTHPAVNQQWTPKDAIANQ